MYGFAPMIPRQLTSNVSLISVPLGLNCLEKLHLCEAHHHQT